MIAQINDMKTIQNRGLKILLEIDAICRRNNIKYFLESGTLLGAVRHKGFIPWDDDVDISMLREDYEMFSKIAKKELPDQYYVQSNANDKHFPFGFTKIIDLNSKFPNNKNKFKTGFCIDVLPIDNAHDNKIIHNFNMLMIKIIQGLTKSKVEINMANYNGLLIKLVVKVASVVGKLLPTRFLMRIQRRIAISNNKKNTKYKCIYSYPFSYLNRLFPSEVYDDVVLLNFEGYDLPVPKGWDKVLCILYNDYMTPPPLDKRTPIHGFDNVIFIDE